MGEGSGSEGVITPVPGGKDVPAVFCTMDAKQCPDGSFVGRVAPSCAFAPCPPNDAPPPPGSCKTNADCEAGYSCIDASPVVREGYQNLRCWKDGMPTPICLSGFTAIATPNGEVMVKDLREGELVWSMTQEGERITAPVRISARTPAPKDHRVVHLVLADGHELFVSPGHKVSDGRTAGALLPGDTLSGVTVLSASLTSYAEEYTYDILPGSDTGMYWGNGILLQSTLW
jgi:hypothetical protein